MLPSPRTIKDPIKPNSQPFLYQDGKFFGPNADCAAQTVTLAAQGHFVRPPLWDQELLHLFPFLRPLDLHPTLTCTGLPHSGAGPSRHAPPSELRANDGYTDFCHHRRGAAPSTLPLFLTPPPHLTSTQPPISHSLRLRLQMRPLAPSSDGTVHGPAALKVPLVCSAVAEVV